MNTKILRIAAATSLAGIALALVAVSASGATCTSSKNPQWGEINFCTAADGLVRGGVVGQGSGTGKYVSVELINGNWATGYGLNAWGQTLWNCTATDFTMDGYSVDDTNGGCYYATGTRVVINY